MKHRSDIAISWRALVELSRDQKLPSGTAVNLSNQIALFMAPENTLQKP